MAHRLTDEAGAPSPFAVAGLRMTAIERQLGRFMRAPDHDDGDDGGAAGDEADDPLRRIAAALGEDDDGDDQDDADNEIPEGEGDEPGPEDTDEQGDEPETAIKPPVSWDNDAKELFAQLPPELQTKVAEREAQREKLIQQRTTEAADAKRNAVAEANTALAAERHQQAQILEQLASQFTLPPEPDPALFQHGEAGAQRFYEMQNERKAAIAQQQQMLQHVDATRQDAEERAANVRQHTLAQETARLIEHFGDDWSDTDKRKAMLTGLEKVGAELGYSPDVMGLAGADDILALTKASEWKSKADKFDALQKQKMSVVRAARDLPRTARPGAPQPPGSAQARVTQQSRDRLRSSGDVKDAAALIAQRL